MGKHEDFLSERDRALLKRAFRIKKPEGLDSLVDSVPDRHEQPQIEFYYDETPLGGRKKHVPHLDCAFRHGARHWRGYVMRYRDGTRMLIGINCGAVHFGLDFSRVEADFNAERSRKRDLERLLAVREVASPALADAQSLPTLTQVAAFDTYRLALRTDFSRLAQLLTQHAQAGGRLTVTSVERDRQAEDRRAERRRPDLFCAIEDARSKGKGSGVVKACVHRLKKWMEAQPPIERFTETDMGPCEGCGILLETQTALLLANKAKDALKGALRPFLDTRSGEWTGRRVTAAIRDLQNALDLTHKLVGLLTALERMGTPNNLKRIADWSAQESTVNGGRIDYAVTTEGRTLIREDTSARIELPASFAIPALVGLDKLQRVLDGE